ncbi:Alpha/Beta hydrolase protein [Penicillium desertorum]|uniref:Alpha/Beta hydrolase protein n=1 Tax=Penicillium desertorum TaxID=1303715 RepID=A0A9W9WK72_9EURO|nr:Alpha/Beta hydrolase protein [Penicillium desertorum]
MDQYNTKEDVVKLGIIDPELKKFLEHNPAPATDFDTLPVEQLRQVVSGIEQSTYESCPTFDTQESATHIPMRDGYQSEIRIVKPQNSSSGNPVVVLIFGGAFVMGSNIQTIGWARMIAFLYGATIVQLSYRLAPEHKFPFAPNDVWDTIQWLVANESAIDADLSRGFVIGGVSAGGNLSIVTAHHYVKEKLSPPITGVLASVPVCISKETIPEKYKDLWVSREQNAHAPGNPGILGGYEVFYQQDFLSEGFSPFNSSVLFSDLPLPRTYVQVAGVDTLRDDGIVYAKALEDNGIEVKFDVYPGMPHGHFNLWPKLEQSIKCQEDTIWHVGWLLRREVSREKVKEVVAML